MQHAREHPSHELACRLDLSKLPNSGIRDTEVGIISGVADQLREIHLRQLPRIDVELACRAVDRVEARHHDLPKDDVRVIALPRRGISQIHFGNSVTLV